VTSTPHRPAIFSATLASPRCGTGLSRMIAAGIDDFTVMALAGHRSVRMLERYTHPTQARRVDALETFTIDGQNLG
jgi:hypothetical protein